MQGLRDLRVIDFSNRIAGAYATKLMADAYAEVIKVEPQEGDTLRRWTASGQDLGDDDGALFQFLNTSKKSVVGELGYKLFMSCYGLIFPAYVWICMIPGRDGHAGITGPAGQRKLVVLGIAALLASPLYWIGWVDGRSVWLLPGLAVLLLARPVALALAGSPAPHHEPASGSST